MQSPLCLIDTSVWIEVFPPRRATAAPALIDHVETLVATGTAATTGVIQVELLAGARSDAQYQQLERALAGLAWLPVPNSVWASASRMAFQLRLSGTTIPVPDLLIAAVALDAGALLLHRDRHFDAIAASFPLQAQSYL